MLEPRTKATAHYGTQLHREVSCGAVDARAREVAVAYARHARTLDEQVAAPHLRVPSLEVRAGRAQSGPVLSRLQEFPPCEGRVWGAYAEASAPVHRLMDFAVTEGATLRWRRMGARSEAEARGFLMQAMRRELGVTAWLCQARMVAWRLSTVGVERLPRREPRIAAPTGPAAEQPRLDDAELARLFLQGLAPVLGVAGPPAA